MPKQRITQSQRTVLIIHVSVEESVKWERHGRFRIPYGTGRYIAFGGGYECDGDTPNGAVSELVTALNTKYAPRKITIILDA